MTRSRTVTVAILLALLASTLMILITSQWGRNQLVHSQVAGCLRTSQRNVALVDLAEADVTANRLVASDPRQSPRTRHARRAEVSAEATVIGIIDAQIDKRLAGTLTSPADRRVVLARKFTCATAYPRSGLVP